MEEQEPKSIYKVTYTYPDGQIKRVEFHNQCTLEEVELWTPHMRLFEKRFGLKRNISQVDDTVVSAVLALSGMTSCKLTDADIWVHVIDKAVSEKKHEKVTDLTKPRSRVKPSSKPRSQIRHSPKEKPEKVRYLKPRRRGQPPSD